VIEPLRGFAKTRGRSSETARCIGGSLARSHGDMRLHVHVRAHWASGSLSKIVPDDFFRALRSSEARAAISSETARSPGDMRLHVHVRAHWAS
jgi:hypothetical protein